MDNIKPTTMTTLMLSLLLFTVSCNSDPAPDITDPPGEEEEVREDISKAIRGMGDWLVATDALGRSLPLYEEAGKFRPTRYVGLFYWLWHVELRNDSATDFDVTKALRINPEREDWSFADYYWAEPELGYYRSNDAFVMQKHLELFCLCGIDFLYLDFTNAIVNAPELEILLDLIVSMRERGYDPPRIVPFLNHEPQHKIDELYNDFYSKEKWKDCWFIYENKPLILSPEQHLSNNVINNYFTWRRMWAAFPPTDENKSWWRFYNTYPLIPAYNNGTLEQAVVSPGIGAPLWDNHIYGSTSSTYGRTPVYDQYWLCEDTGKGLFFEEQWREAHKIDAPILCITGWNEWKAGAWNVDESLAAAGFKFQGKVKAVGEKYFVDQFNEEFNRDLEPQAGTHTDNYFYQMAGHVRRYKGMVPLPEASAPRTIAIDGVFDEWKYVLPVYVDFEEDIKVRDNAGAPRGTHYTNNTLRNDIVETRTTYDDNYIYFYVKTSRNISDWSDPYWMMLYIDSDMDKSTGWEGYDYLINYDVKSATQTVLHERQGDKWEEKGVCNLRVSGREMEIAVSREAIGQSGKPSFYFHWVDNIQKIDDITEFFVNGESAPKRRYNYFFTAK